MAARHHPATRGRSTLLGRKEPIINQRDIAQPYFEPDLVADNLEDGYWLEAVDINGDGKPDLVASGLAAGEVVWYENPGWKKHLIATFDKPVALDLT